MNCRLRELRDDLLCFLGPTHPPVQRPHYIEYQWCGMSLGADQPCHSLDVQLVIAGTDEGRQLNSKLIHADQLFKEWPRAIHGCIKNRDREPLVAPGVLYDRPEQRALVWVPYHAECPRQLITHRQV